MCLGVPGKVVRVEMNPIGIPMGVVNFGGVTKEVCLSFVPDVVVGDFVIVHAGFAISQVDEEQAAETLKLLRMLDPQAVSEVTGEGGGGES